MQRAGRLRQLIAMHDVILRNASNARGQLAQNIREQTEMDMHLNSLVHVVGAGRSKTSAMPVGSRCASKRDERSNVPT